MDYIQSPRPQARNPVPARSFIAGAGAWQPRPTAVASVGHGKPCPAQMLGSMRPSVALALRYGIRRRLR